MGKADGESGSGWACRGSMRWMVTLCLQSEKQREVDAGSQLSSFSFHSIGTPAYGVVPFTFRMGCFSVGHLPHRKVCPCSDSKSHRDDNE